MTMLHAFRFFLPLLFLLTSVTSMQAQEFKVATVDMGYLIRNYYRHQEAEDEQDFEVAEIRKADQDRKLAIQQMREELEDMIAEMNDPSLSIKRRTEIQQQAKSKQADLMALEREREVFLGRRDNALTQKMASLQNEIVKSVMNAVDTYAATQDVDFVFDESGISRSEVPFLVYVRNRIDLTDPVLKILNKDAPEGFEPRDLEKADDDDGEGTTAE